MPAPESVRLSSLARPGTRADGSGAAGARARHALALALSELTRAYCLTSWPCPQLYAPSHFLNFGAGRCARRCPRWQVLHACESLSTLRTRCIQATPVLSLPHLPYNLLPRLHKRCTRAARCAAPHSLRTCAAPRGGLAPRGYAPLLVIAPRLRTATWSTLPPRTRPRAARSHAACSSS